MDRGAWWAIIHGVAKSQIPLSTRVNTSTPPHTHTSILVSQFIPPPFPCVIHKFVLYICVSVPFVHRFICTIFSGFHTETILYKVFFFSFWLTSLCMTISVSTYICKWHNFVPLCGWIIFRCIYVPHPLYAFLCWWTFRLLPRPDCCRSCCSGRWGARVFLNYGFLQVCPGVNWLSEEQALNTGWWLISDPFSGNECVSSLDPNILNILLVTDFLRLEMTNIKDSNGIKSSSSIDSKFIESTFLPA